MKEKMTIGLLVLAIVASGAFWWITTCQERLAIEDSENAALQNSPPTVDKYHDGKPENVQQRTDVPHGLLPLNAKTGQELFRLLSGPAYTRGEEAYFRLAISQLCTVMPKSNLAPAVTRPERKLSDATVESFRRGYCAGLGNGADEFTAFNQLDPDDRVGQAYELAALVSDPSEKDQNIRTAIGLLESMMLAEDGGIESLVAAQTLEQLGHVAPAVQALAMERGLQLSPSELAVAQTLASQLTLCGRYGGCGPGQSLTMQQCSFSGSCAPSRTAFDVWRNNHSPAVLQAAQAIGERRSMERRWRGS